MNRPVLAWGSVFVCYFSLIMYGFRGYYTQPFDASYWKDKYEHSQWKLPLSQRIIGDDGLYLYEGYRLVHGDDPSLLSAEVPPLGKYAIGVFAAFVDRPHLFGFLSTALELLVFYLFCRSIFRTAHWALVTVMLFALDPLLVSQFHLTMMESLQLLFLVLSLFSLVRFRNDKSPLWVIVSGVAIGLFSETKVPIFTPLFFALSLWYLWKTSHRLKTMISYCLSALVGYLLPYTNFFLLGHTLVDFLKVQKWMAVFYETSNLSPNTGSAFTTLVANRYQNLFTGNMESVPEWSVSWPLLFFLGIFGLLFAVRSKHPREKHIWILLLTGTGGMLLLLSVVPFWTRYLLITLPFLCLGAVHLLQKFRFGLIIVAVLILGNSMSSLSILFPTPEKTVRLFFYNWQHGFFQDMYKDLTGQEKQNTHRAEFHTFGLMRFSEAEIENVSVQTGTVRWQQYHTRQLVPVTIAYSTRHLDAFTHTIKLPVVLENGRWRIEWNWSLLFPELDQNKYLETNVSFARRGTIRDKNGTVLAQDIESSLIWVIPGNVNRNEEQDLLTYLERLFGGEPKAISFHQRIFGNSQPDIPIPLGVPKRRLFPEEIAKLTRYRGVLLTPHPGRMINDYSVSNIEKEQDEVLKGENGGTLVVKDTDGNIGRALIAKVKRDGKDIQLPL